MGRGRIKVDFSVEVKTPGQLSDRERTAWIEFRAENPVLYSPYFHPDYTNILGQYCKDVHVLVVSKKNSPIAFLPFQAKIGNRGKIGFARPVGAPMTDYYGFICKSDTVLDVFEVLKRSRVGAFHFSANVQQNDLFDDYVRDQTPCCVADISAGGDAWRAARNSSYRRHLKSHRRRVRKSEELGPRQMVFKSRDTAVFDRLIAWKRQKFVDTKKYDVLSADWTRALLQKLWARDDADGLRAEMHALYFGDHLAAIDLGLTDGETFHSWMVAYNNELNHLAPGIQLLEELVDAGPELGYSRLDLGEGLDGYKRHYATEEVQVSSGYIAVAGPAAAFSRIYDAAENFAENRLGDLGRLPGKARRRYAQINACEPRIGGRAKAVLAAAASVSLKETRER